MEIIRDIDTFKSKFDLIATIGNFDGVHLGHCSIIDKLKQIGFLHNFKTCVITFFPHPKKVLYNHEVPLLTTFEEKAFLLEKLGLDYLVVLPFDLKFAQLSAFDFVEKILIQKLNIKSLVLGHDHKFGKDQEGGIQFLEKNKDIFKIQIEEISQFTINNIGISSSKIRLSLQQGELESANILLGRNYSIEGLVEKGKQLGRTIGYPTANVQIEDLNKILPLIGVYAALVYIGNRVFKGMLNIGNRPTVDGRDIKTEVHIFDFNQDIYHQKIKVEFVSRLRSEEKFENLEKLKLQLDLDKQNALGILV